MGSLLRALHTFFGGLLFTTLPNHCLAFVVVLQILSGDILAHRILRRCFLGSGSCIRRHGRRRTRHRACWLASCQELSVSNATDRGLGSSSVLILWDAAFKAMLKRGSRLQAGGGRWKKGLISILSNRLAACMRRFQVVVRGQEMCSNINIRTHRRSERESHGKFQAVGIERSWHERCDPGSNYESAILSASHPETALPRRVKSAASLAAIQDDGHAALCTARHARLGADDSPSMGSKGSPQAGGLSALTGSLCCFHLHHLATGISHPKTVFQATRVFRTLRSIRESAFRIKTNAREGAVSATGLCRRTFLIRTWKTLAINSTTALSASRNVGRAYSTRATT